VKITAGVLVGTLQFVVVLQEFVIKFSVVRTVGFAMDLPVEIFNADLRLHVLYSQSCIQSPSLQPDS
jgi:hypothetical protein